MDYHREILQDCTCFYCGKSITDPQKELRIDVDLPDLRQLKSTACFLHDGKLIIRYCFRCDTIQKWITTHANKLTRMTMFIAIGTVLIALQFGWDSTGIYKYFHWALLIASILCLFYVDKFTPIFLKSVAAFYGVRYLWFNNSSELIAEVTRTNFSDWKKLRKLFEKVTGRKVDIWAEIINDPKYPYIN